MIAQERYKQSTLSRLNGHRPEAHVLLPSEVEYEYMDMFDQTDEQIVESLKSYEAAAHLYSVKEWETETVEGVLKHLIKVYRPYIANLPDDALVFMPGVGTARDAFFMTALKNKLKVVASDLTSGMLSEAQARLSWRNFLKLGEVLSSIIKEGLIVGQESWAILELIQLIGEVAERIEKIKKLSKNKDSENLSVLSVLDSNRIIDSYLERVIFSQEDIGNLPYAKNTFDLAMCVAVLPHKKKKKMADTIIGILEVLKPGCILYGDLRVDKELWKYGEQGRVFRDNAIKDPANRNVEVTGNRFFSTYTRSEMDALIMELIKRMPGIEIIDRNINPHPDKNKPPFAHLGIKKPAA